MKKFLFLVVLLGGCAQVAERETDRLPTIADVAVQTPAFKLTNVMFAADDPTPIVTAESGLYWDKPTQNIDNSPYDDHSHYVLALAMVGADLNAGAAARFEKQVDCVGSVCGVNVRDFFGVELDQGTQAVWVRAVDKSGNESGWGGPLLISNDSIIPGVPLNFRFEIKFVITQ